MTIKVKIFHSINMLTLIIVLIFTGWGIPRFSYAGNSITIKMATLAPNGSPWHEILKDMGAEWNRLSNGEITLRIYPGGVAGDEGDVVRKMRIGQLQAAAVSNAGLSRIDEAVYALTIPMAVESWEELDTLLAALGPKIEKILADEGFILLNWGDGGWVRFFVPEASPDIETVRKARLFTMAGDDKATDIWKSAGFNVIPLAATDILPGLQSGMINAYNTSAILALASQWFAFTPYMIDMPWAPLVGATIINKKTWEQIPDDLKPQLMQSAHRTGERLKIEIRRLEEQAILEMEKRGLKVITPDAAQLQQWKGVMKGAYPRIRGAIIPADLFDLALEILNKREGI